MNKISITPSDVLEFLFCKRFIYFMYCLNIPQFEENRYKVLRGRDAHKEKNQRNKSYLRKKLKVIRKESECYLSSEKHSMRGIVDEILFMEDSTAAPLDFKFAEYKEKLFKTYRIQSVMYALMIEETFNLQVNKGYISFLRSAGKMIEIEITEASKNEVMDIMEEILEIIKKGHFPRVRTNTMKCVDCCYKNICIK